MRILAWSATSTRRKGQTKVIQRIPRDALGSLRMPAPLSKCHNDFVSHQACQIDCGTTIQKARLVGIGSRIFDHWKPYPKDRSAIGGFGGNRAVMGLDDRTHDGQAEPDA